MFNYILSDSNITVLADAKVRVFAKQDAVFDRVVEAVKANDEATLLDLINRPVAITRYAARGNIEFRDHRVFYKGAPLHEAIAGRVVDLFDQGFPIDHLLVFLDNLMQNPSNSAIQELYEFLAACNLPITPDGCFLAYKLVQDNYKDVHSGTYDNSVGQVVRMERRLVDDRRENTCSHGLHVCSLGYLGSFYGDRLMLVKVNPRDVVSIPSDYGNTKMRVCEYHVIQELDKNTIQEFNDSLQAVYVEPEPAFDDGDEDDEPVYDDESDYDYGIND